MKTIIPSVKLTTLDIDEKNQFFTNALNTDAQNSPNQLTTNVMNIKSIKLTHHKRLRSDIDASY